MKKHLILIIVALFICTNIATFIFAHGRTGVIEKVVTVYKEIREPNYATSLKTGKISRRPAEGNAVLEAVLEKDKDARSYKTSGSPATGEDKAGSFQNEKVINAPEVSERIAGKTQGGAFYSGASAPQTEETEEPLSADEYSEPLPQFPLSSADFEVATSEDDFSGTPLPALPGLDEIQ